MTPRTLAIIPAILLLLSISLETVHAEVTQAAVIVKGMSCPFCAFGVEKRLKKVEGVESVTVNMKDGTASLSAGKGESINFSKVPEAVRNAGFTPGTIRVVVTGTVKADEAQRLFLQFDGSGQRLLFTELNETMKGSLFSHARSGEPVEVRGIIRQQRDGTWSILPESVGRASR